MARKTLNYTVIDEGRDKGKVFIITEMPHSKSEMWAMKVIMALIRGGFEVPDGYEQNGLAGLAQLGIKALAFIPFNEVEGLLAEMMDCIQFVPTPSKPHIVRPLFDGDIEEISTSVKLRKEWLSMQMGFLLAVAPSSGGPVEKSETYKTTKMSQK